MPPERPRGPRWFTLAVRGVLELPELPDGTALELHLVTRDGHTVARWLDARGRVLRVAAVGLV